MTTVEDVDLHMGWGTHVVTAQQNLSPDNKQQHLFNKPEQTLRHSMHSYLVLGLGRADE